MNMTNLRGRSGVGKTLGLVLIASIAIGALLSFFVVSQVRAIMAVPGSSDIAQDSAEYADCLWYSARNHGFYQVQRELVRGNVTDDNRILWVQFLDSAGAADCGPGDFQVEALLDALANTAFEADRFFLAAQ